VNFSEDIFAVVVAGIIILYQAVLIATCSKSIWIKILAFNKLSCLIVIIGTLAVPRRF
jgi:hypothetical protein